MTSVKIVGAGIGSSDLITIKGKRTLDNADVIIYDRLLNEELLTDYFNTKEMYYVGKKAGDHYLTQDEINDLMVSKAKEGKEVVRLKGGDPYVFGRGGEEAEYLIENGLDFEVVPGVTSGIVSLMYAGIPATHRDTSTSISFITGHRKADANKDFKQYSQLKGTLVFYMGLNNLESITRDLTEGGMEPGTPAAVIMKGGYPSQKVFVSTVENISSEIASMDFGSPSLIVIGEVVKYRETLNFFEEKILFGKNIVNTRALSQASVLSNKLKDLGANVIDAPTIEIQEVNSDLLDRKITTLDYTHIVFHSVNAAEIFMTHFLELRDIRDLASIEICVIGEKTKEVFEKYGIRPDVMPKKYVGEELIASLLPNIDESSKVFLPHSSITRHSLINDLKEQVNLDELIIYENNLPEAIITLPQNIDYILFTSSSTVNNFIELYGRKILEDTKIISIGDITSATLEEHNLQVYKQSEIATIDSMIEIIKDDVL